MRPTIKVTIKDNQLPRLRSAAPDKADRAIGALAQEGKSYVVQSFGTSPSVAGEPPGVDTGFLRSSVQVQNSGQMRREIRVGADYGAYLEFGTTRMAARPYMGPMALWLEDQVEAIFDVFLS
jgi:Bacteriophage HK97-gp10, putative tail-component